MIKRPKDEILVAYSGQELQDLLGGEDFIITPSGEGMSLLYLFSGAEGGTEIQKCIEHVVSKTSYECDYIVLTLRASIEEIQNMLNQARFVYS